MTVNEQQHVRPPQLSRYQRFYKTWSEADDDAGQFEVVMYSPENGWYLFPDFERIIRNRDARFYRLWAIAVIVYDIGIIGIVTAILWVGA